MANKVLIRRSAVASAIPTTGQLALGELAINTNDGYLFLKKNDGADQVVRIGGNIQLGDFGADVSDAFQFLNGATIDPTSITVTSNGTTITLSMEQNGTGDVRILFSDGLLTLDCTPAATITLTAGTDTAPQANYIYIPQSTKVLTLSTTGFPGSGVEYAPIATVICQSAASLQTDGPYKFHAWSDHTYSSAGCGHMAHLNYWVRSQHATWQSGVAQTITAGLGQLDIATGSGVVLQLHQQTYPAFDTSTGSDVYVVNHGTTAYKKCGSLSIADGVDQDVNGTTLGGALTKFYNLVIWGVASETTGDCKMMVNVPDGAYANNNLNTAVNDVNNTAIYDIPEDYKGTGFLISRIVVSITGTTYTLEHEEDLRGKIPAATVGGSSGTGLENVVDDLTPQLGADLDTQGYRLETTTQLSYLDLDDVATVLNSEGNLSLNSSGNGGIVQMNGGTSASGTGGVVKMQGGQGTAATGGEAQVKGGVGAATGGAVTITGATGTNATSTGGAVTISAGDGGATNGAGGDVNISAGDAQNTGANVVISAGDNTNDVGGYIDLRPGDSVDNGSSYVRIIPKTGNESAYLMFMEGPNNGSNWVRLNAPGSITTNRTWRLPVDDPSTAAGQFLTTNSSGHLSFAAAGGIADVVDDLTPQLGGDLDTNSKKILGAPPVNAGAAGGDLVIQGQAGGTSAGAGGLILIESGPDGAGGNNSGSVTIRSADAVNASSGVGAVSISTGDPASDQSGSTLTISAGSATGSGWAGAIQIAGGDSVTGNASDIDIIAGDSSSSGDGGTVSIKAGNSVSGTDGTIEITGEINATPITGNNDISLRLSAPGSNEVIFYDSDGTADQRKFIVRAPSASQLDIGACNDAENSFSTAMRFHRSGAGINQIEMFDPMRGQNGAFTAPTYSFSGSTNSGVFYDPTAGATGVGFSAGGSKVAVCTDVGWKLKEVTAPTTDLAGHGWVYVDSADGNLKFRDDLGTVTDLTAGGGISNVVEDTTPQLGGDLDLNGNNIIGDWSASPGSRVAFQSSVTDGISAVTIIPNGTSVDSYIVMENASTVANNEVVSLGINGTHAFINSSKRGTGTALPFQIRMDGSTVFEIETDSTLNVAAVTDYETLVTADDDIPNRKWVTDQGYGTGTLSNVVEDTTPQLGGDLDIQAYRIYSSGTTMNILYPSAQSSGTAGQIKIEAQDHTGAGGFGGNLLLEAGSNTTNGSAGTFQLKGGSGTVFGGDLKIIAGNAVAGSSTGGNILIDAGYNSNTGFGVGYVQLGCGDGNTSVQLRFREARDNGTNYIALRSPHNVTTSRTWYLPDTAPVNGYVLQTDASGNLSFVAPSGGIANVVEDTTPQLGGTLDVNDQIIEAKPNGGSTNPGNDITIQATDAGSGGVASGGDLFLKGGGIDTIITGAEINILGSLHNGKAGSIEILAGDPQGATNYAGGDVTIAAGGGLVTGNTSGGEVYIKAGQGGSTGTGGDIRAVLRAGGTGGIGNFIIETDDTGASQEPSLRIFSKTGTGAVTLNVPNMSVLYRTWTLPDDDPTVAAGKFLTTDSSGVMSFAAAADPELVSIDQFYYTATAAQTTFSGSDDNTNTLSYVAGTIQVFLNGVLLDPADYTATNGTSVVLDSGATADDLITISAPSTAPAGNKDYGLITGGVDDSPDYGSIA